MKMRVHWQGMASCLEESRRASNSKECFSEAHLPSDVVGSFVQVTVSESDLIWGVAILPFIACTIMKLGVDDLSWSQYLVLGRQALFAHFLLAWPLWNQGCLFWSHL